MDDALRHSARAARDRVRTGALRGPALRAELTCVPPTERDAWLDELLGLDALPADGELPPGAVPYLPSGVAEILALIDRVPIRASDELLDVGAGLGRVAISVHLLTGTRTRGVEIQGHLVARARRCCEELGVTGASFVHANAAEVELDGSVMFLYAPCNGALLARVLGRIAAAARARPLVVCTAGLELSAPWLTPRSNSDDSLMLYDTRSC